MEINNLHNNHNQSSAVNNPQSQKIASDEINTKEQETLESSDKTVNRSEEVNISNEARRRSSNDDEDSRKTPIKDSNQARDVAKKINVDLRNNSSVSVAELTGNINKESILQVLA